MSAETPFLLVIDPGPEGAAQINSQLRNAGISIHILHADNLTEAERLVREHQPVLIYYLPTSRALFPVVQAATLARQHETFLALRLSEGGHALYQEAIRTTACLGVGNDEHLPDLVRNLISLGQAAKAEDRFKAQEQELESRLDLLMNSTRDPIAYFHEGLHVAANQAYQELLGVDSFDELAMMSLLEILEQDGTDLKALIRAFGRQEFPDGQQTFRLRPPGGEPREATIRFAPVRFDGEDCVQMLVDLDEDMAAAVTEPVHVAPPASAPAASPSEATAAPAPPAPTAMPAQPQPSTAGDATLDPVTGMYWRAPFMSQLEVRLTTMPEDQRGAVFYLELDDAVTQLAELGVAEMDQYVEAAASELLSCLGDDDDVSRFTDSAYVIFAIREDKAALRHLAEKIRAGIERLSIDQPDQPLPPSCSVGMFLLDRQHNDAEHSLSNARSAWKLAAAEGNCVKRFKPARQAGVSEDEESEWCERIRYALDNEDFYTVQHSIMNLEGDLEGLVENHTFMHEDAGDIASAAYLPAAERNQLASQVDRHIIPGLLRAVARADEHQIIEISGNSLQDFSFAAWFQRTLQEQRVPGKRIVLQWPAWAAQQQSRAAKRLIEELAPMGIRFSLSGVDADAKTLAVIEQLDLQFLTLPPALTCELQANPERLDQIRSVVAAAEARKIHAIASGVPSSGDLAMLWQCGVKLVSGEFLQETPRVIGQ